MKDHTFQFELTSLILHRFSTYRHLIDEELALLSGII